MTERQAIKKSIKHWEEMRDWVKKQPKEGGVDRNIMAGAIGVTWQGPNCSLCILYANECEKCPLSKRYVPCGQGNTESAWDAVDNTPMWGIWYKRSTLMLKQLKSLLPKRRVKK